MADKTKNRLVKKRYLSLSDEDIREASEYTPFSEATPVYDKYDIEPKSSFFGVAERVAGAAAVEAAKLKTGQARALFHMRSFYLLGVLHGAEAYRAMQTGEYERKKIPFIMDNSCAAEFREELEQLPPEVFQSLCSLLGLSVQWVDRPEGGQHCQNAAGDIYPG